MGVFNKKNIYKFKLLKLFISIVGDIVADYNPIKPDKDSGSHRTLILNFKQFSFLKIETRIKEQESRLKFSLDDFIQKYNLDKPNAGNFYICSD